MRLLLIFLLTSVWLPAAQPAAVRPVMRDFIGLCGHTVQFRPALYKPVCGWVRDYHPVEWDLGKDTSSQPKWPFAANGVDWQKVYGSWQAEGLAASASLMFESIAQGEWKSLERDLEAYGRTFAREFGPGGSRKLLGTVEVGNEPGKWDDASYSRVLKSLSAGLRAGDPSLRIATCNLTLGKSHDYAKSVSCLDGLEQSYDILNSHVYPQLEGWPTWRRSYPEDPALKDWLGSVSALCQWRDQHVPGKAVWVTEYGYDATDRKPDPASEFARWQGVTSRQQALWLVRSTLLLAAAPVERVAVYFFNDDDKASVHGASGLTRNFQPRPAYHAMAHLMSVLGDYRFEALVEHVPGVRMVQRYRHASRADSECLVIWRPAGDGGTSRMELSLAAAAAGAKWSRTPLDASPATVPPSASVDVTETPLFLHYTRPAH